METNKKMSGTSRREFVTRSAFGIAVLSLHRCELAARPDESEVLISLLFESCRRLAMLGWRDLLLDATGGQLDLLAKDLESELVKPLTKIDRTFTGFGDFA